MKFTSTVAGASIFIALMSVFGRGIGFIREIIYASYFGTFEEFEVYLIGAVLPLTISTSIYYISQNYFIPEYNRYIDLRSGDAHDFVNRIFWIFILIGVLISIILYVFIDPIIDFYVGEMSESSRELTINTFTIFLFTIPLTAGIAVLSVFLESEFEFIHPSVSRLVLNVSTILFVLFLGKQIGVIIIAIGYLSGTIFQLVYLLLKVRLKIINPLKVSFNNREKISAVFSFSMLSIILIEIISQLYAIFDRYFYNEISSGGIAALNYAQTIFLLPVGIFSAALSTVIFPKLSTALKENSNEVTKFLLQESTLITLFLFIPFSFMFLNYSSDIINMIYERGNFNELSTSQTASALQLYAIGLVFYGVYAILNKIFYSMGYVKTLLFITFLGLLIKFCLNFILVEALGHRGLAIATSISYIFFFVSCFLFLNFKLHLKLNLVFMTEFTLMLINAGLSLLITELVIDGVISISSIIFIIKLIFFNGVFVLNLFVINHRISQVLRDVYNRLKNKS
jgi:putative peptidoglycan lipid II flippase